MNLIQRAVLTFIMTLAALLPNATLAADSLNTEQFKTCILAFQRCAEACQKCADVCKKMAK